MKKKLHNLFFYYLKITVAVTAPVLFCSGSFAQAGVLDLSFGNGGKVTTDLFNTSDDNGRAMAVTSDGGIVLAGSVVGSVPGYNGTDFFGIIKYDSNGKIDSSFGTNGKTVSLIGFSPVVNALAIQPDNKILIVGTSQFAYFCIVRYLPNGLPDSSFGINGIAYQFNQVTIGLPKAIAIQGDGKIVVAGNFSGSSLSTLILVRYQSNGTYDSAFGVNGRAETGIGADAGPMGMVIQPDGKYVVATNNSESMAVARLNLDGTPDQTFSNGFSKGFTLIRSSTYFDGGGSSLFLRADGKIVVGGILSQGVVPVLGLARLDSTGQIDNTFGNDGLQVTDLGSSSYGYAIAKQSDDKILLAGYARSPQTGFINFVVARYSQDGIPDSTFGTNGYTTTDFGFSTNNYAYAMQVQPDQKIVLAGYTNSFFGGDKNFAVARYNNDASVLPLSLLSFTATLQENRVLLNWLTASDVNVTDYIVERSRDAVHFAPVGHLASKRNAIGNQTYSYTDESPLLGTNYYRLQQKNNNGQTDYTAIAKIVFTQRVTTKILPNPAHNLLSVIDLPRNTSFTYTIADNAGRIVKSGTALSSQPMIQISSLSKGLYFLILHQEKQIFTIEFLKQ